MKQRLQGLIAGVLIGTTLTGGTVLASKGTKTIEILYNNIKVYKDNVLCELKDANGSVIEPFVYNGTTYMPVRGTANLAGMEVEWDGATQSVYLWDEIPMNGTYLLEVCPPYATDGYRSYIQQKGESFAMSGTKYSNGFTLGDEGYAYFNLNSKYSNIEFDIGHLDGTELDDCTISFFADGKLIEEIVVEGDGLPQTISLPVNYALQLKVLFSDTTSGRIFPDGQVGFGNVTVK